MKYQKVEIVQRDNGEWTGKGIPWLFRKKEDLQAYIRSKLKNKTAIIEGDALIFV